MTYNVFGGMLNLSQSINRYTDVAACLLLLSALEVF